jgi:hypothetical protein
MGRWSRLVRLLWQRDQRRRGGAAAGGFARKRVNGLTPGAVIPITVGAGGIAGTTAGPSWPTAGGTTSFGTYCSATGGQLNPLTTPTANLDFAGGPGGAGTGGDVNIQGSSGGLAATSTRSNNQGGYGGAPAIGSSIASGAGAGLAGIAPGGGASGAGTGANAATLQTGAAGAPGMCIVRW